MKQFFNYHSKISSLELSQAFATIMAPGPFIGFANGISRDNLNLEIWSDPDPDDTCALVVQQYLDQTYRRYISKRYKESSGKPKFGCITKDGTIYTSDEVKLTVPIQGTRGTNYEIFLFAVHSQIEEDIENPVTFVAYWNSSNEAIYPLYEKSVNVYYQQQGGDVTDPTLDSDLTFTNLDNKVKRICTEYSNNYDSYTLMCVCGKGTNLDLVGEEPYTLVPYFSQFPMSLNYNTAIHSALIKSLEVITALQKKLKGEIGEIHMYAGNTVPDGYLLCNGQAVMKSLYPELYNVIGDIYNNGISEDGSTYTTTEGYFRVPDLRSRFVVGSSDTKTKYLLTKTGGSETVTLSADQLPTHHHEVDMMFFAEHHGSISKQGKADGFYGLIDGVLTKGHQGNVTGASEEGYPGLQGNVDVDNDTLPYVTIDSGDQGGNKSHDNIPPYYALMYIIRSNT